MGGIGVYAMRKFYACIKTAADGPIGGGRANGLWPNAELCGTYGIRSLPARAPINPMKIFKPSNLAPALAALSFIAQSTLLAQVTLNSTPSRVLGQRSLSLTTANPNQPDARGLNSPQGVAIDTSVTPNALYVSDSGNNRILGWKDAKTASGSPADLVIGQRDFFSTFRGGPGTGLQTGFNVPVALVTDKSGNLYILDAGNNRIMRFPKPFGQTGETIQPDMVIGQTTFNGSNPNQGDIQLNCTAKTIYTADSNQVFRSTMIFDASGNLWFADAGNHRVLRYPAKALDDGLNAPAADLAVGQFTLELRATFDNSIQVNVRQKTKTTLFVPAGLALDDKGRLYVSDLLSRVLVFENPRTGGDASRIAGVAPTPVQGQPPRPSISEYTIGGSDGILVVGGQLLVVDSVLHRIVRFDPFEQWPVETTLVPSPPAKFVIGQPDLLSFRVQRNQKEPSDQSFAGPVVAVFGGNDMFVVDSGNHRILAFSNPSNGNFGTASRVLGQATMQQFAPNWVEGRELFLFRGYTANAVAAIGGGIVVDKKSNPPHLYIADTYNNRVLGYNDIRNVKPGDAADIVIGQTDLTRTQYNAPGGDIDQPLATGLVSPSGVAVDADGNLWVTDTGNGRALRFPSPFSQPAGQAQRANLVIGQISFTAKNTDASRNTLGQPVGIAFTVDGHVAISDVGHNRVLLYRKPTGGDFSNGQAAATVFGQPDFTSAALGTATQDNRLYRPLQIATDTDDRLYVCDPGKNRVVIYNRIVSAPNDPAPAFFLNAGSTRGATLNGPHGVYVSEKTGEIWVADARVGRVNRYPRFDLLPITDGASFFIQVADGTLSPIAVTLDGSGNLLVADSGNRITLHYPTLSAVNAASFAARPLSPGMIASLFPAGSTFGEETKSFSTLPLPTDLGDVTVTLNGVPAPLFFVSPGQINFQVPWSMPTSGTVDMLVTRKSVGQILSAATIQMYTALPGFFSVGTTANGAQMIAAINEDNTINGPGNPSSREKIVTLYLTGLGYIDTPPADGAAPAGALNTTRRPSVIINTSLLNDDQIKYSGLAPGFVGVWQLNLFIPKEVPPSSSTGGITTVVVGMDSVFSNQLDASRRIAAGIFVKQ